MSKASLEIRLGYRLKRLNAALRAAMDDALRATELSTPQHITLAALAANPLATNAMLARVCYVTPQTMNEIIRGLVKAKLVARAADKGDPRREIALELTAEGKKRLLLGEQRSHAVESAALAALPEKEREKFLDHLTACAAILESRRR